MATKGHISDYTLRLSSFVMKLGKQVETDQQMASGVVQWELKGQPMPIKSSAGL